MKRLMFFFVIILLALSCDEIWDPTDTHQESSAERLVGKLPLMSLDKDTSACTKTGNMWDFILNNKIDSVWNLTSDTAEKNFVYVRGFYSTETTRSQKFIASVLFFNQNKITKMDSIKSGWNW
jgi:hypothetical protein